MTRRFVASSRLTSFTLALFAASVAAQTAPQAPTRRPPVTIFSPQEGENLGAHTVVIKGSVQDPKLNVYVLVHPLLARMWWVQPMPSPPNPDGTWRSVAYFGTDDAGKGEPFEIVAIASPQPKLLHEGQQLSMQEAKSLFEKHLHSDIISVTRQ